MQSFSFIGFVKSMLKVPSIVHRITNHALTVFRNVKNQTLERTPDRDIFIRTLKTPYISEKRVREIYDEIYSEVMRQNIENNPILEDVTINKPKINFGKPNNGISEAVYSPDDNAIIINRKYLNTKKCAVVIYNKDGIPVSCCFFDKTLLKYAIKKLKKDNADFKVMDLNQNELEIYLKGILAHELRHCIQNHLAFSSVSACEIIDRARREYESKKNNSDDTDDELQKSYLFRYKPKKILPKGTKFKMSLDKEDGRYWSIDEDFVLATARSVLVNVFDREEYLADIKEQDAFKYQYEYCLSKINEWENITSAREEVLTCYLADIRSNFINNIK